MSGEEVLQASPEPIVLPVTIIDVHLDEVAGVYKIVIASPVAVVAHKLEVQAIGDDDQPIFDTVPLRDEAGEEVGDADGNPMSIPQPRMVVRDVPQQIIGYIGEEDFVFAADDERWFADGVRRPHDEVIAEQREIIKQALADRAARAQAEQEAAQAAIIELPGAGEEL